MYVTEEENLQGRRDLKWSFTSIHGKFVKFLNKSGVKRAQHSRGRKSARKKRPQEVIKEEKEKKIIDMMNRRISLETNPNPIIEYTAVHPINLAQEKRKN